MPSASSASRVACAIALAATTTAWSADMTVRALDKVSGEPLPDASICLGTPADPVQLGAVRTGRDGQVTFEAVPDARLVVTVGKPGYRGERRALQGGRAESLTFLLQTGGGGPVCRAPAQAVRDDILEVADFRIDGDAGTTDSREVVLEFTAAGTATHYRAGESPDLEAVPWQPLGAEPPRFRLSPGPGEKRIYLQLRKFHDAAGATLETRSEVVSDTIRLNPSG